MHPLNALKSFATPLLSLALIACGPPQDAGAEARAAAAESGPRLPLPAARAPTDTDLAWYRLLHPGVVVTAPELAASPAWQAQARLDDWGGQTDLLVESKAWLDQALANDPDDPQALMQLARYAVMSGDAGGNRGALEMLDRVLAAHPDLADAYVLQAHVMTNAGVVAGAHAALDKAAALGATSPWLSLNRATLFANEGRAVEAAQLCTAVIEDNVPSSKAMVAAYQCRQTMLLRRRDFAGIDRDYLASLALRPDDPFTLINYAHHLCFHAERCIDATAYLRHARQYGERPVMRDIDGAIRYDAWARLVAEQGAASPAAAAAFVAAREVMPDLEHAMARYGGRTGGAAVVDALAARGVAVDAFDHNHTSALMHAAMLGDAGLTTALLAHGANPALVDRQHWSALMYAARAGHLPVIVLLTAAMADDPTLPMQAAAAAGVAGQGGHAEAGEFLDALAPQPADLRR